jgi:hypothetical protein
MTVRGTKVKIPVVMIKAIRLSSLPTPQTAHAQRVDEFVRRKPLSKTLKTQLIITS